MTVHILVSGNVHGVGFRQYVKYHAKKLNVAGWITNLPNGKVEAVFQGPENGVMEMVKVSKRGPFLADVENVEVDWNHKVDTDIIDFQIIK